MAYCLKIMYPSLSAVDLIEPGKAAIHWEDIAWALSMQCRFGGSCSRQYSVAEHSIYVMSLLPSHLALQGLLHDAHEAYIQDIVTGMKTAIGPGWGALEQLWANRIRDSFGLPRTLDYRVRVADLQALAGERLALGLSSDVEWPTLQGITAPPEPPPELTQRVAFQTFLNYLKELTCSSRTL